MGPGQGNMTIGNTGGFFSDIFDNLGQIGSAISPAIPGIAGTLLTGEAYNRLSDVGSQAQRQAMELTLSLTANITKPVISLSLIHI